MDDLRIAVLSDLHLESDRAQPHVKKLLRGRRRNDPTPVDDDGHPLYGPRLDALRHVDLIVAAGDIDVKTWPVPWLDAASRYTGRPWVYVAGNHEAYDRPIEHALQDLRMGLDATAGRVCLLENDRRDAVIGGRTRVAVLGCTLWTDHALLGSGRLQNARDRCEQGMNDHRYIRRAGGTMRWTAVAAERTHAVSRRWLEDALPQAHAEADVVVVVSHHAPSIQSIPQKNRQKLLATAYASDLEDIMTGDAAPALWVHGHVHEPVDYHIGATRVVSAPRGRLGYEHGVLEWQPRIVTVQVPCPVPSSSISRPAP